MIERALVESHAHGFADLEPLLSCTRANLHRLLGKSEDAWKGSQAAVRLARRSKNQSRIAYSLECRARAAAMLGRVREARRDLRAAKRTLTAGSPIDLATILLSEA